MASLRSSKETSFRDSSGYFTTASSTNTTFTNAVLSRTTDSLTDADMNPDSLLESALLRKLRQQNILERSHIAHLKSRIAELEAKNQICIADDFSQTETESKYLSQLQKEGRDLEELLRQSKLLYSPEITVEISNKYQMVKENLDDVKNYISESHKILKQKQDAIHDLMNSVEYEESQKQRIKIESLRARLTSLKREGQDIHEKQQQLILKNPEIEILSQKVDYLQKKLALLQSEEREKRSELFKLINDLSISSLRTKSRRKLNFQPKITIPVSTPKKYSSKVSRNQNTNSLDESDFNSFSINSMSSHNSPTDSNRIVKRFNSSEINALTDTDDENCLSSQGIRRFGMITSKDAESYKLEEISGGLQIHLPMAGSIQEKSPRRVFTH
ncbi:hypothetical protein TRFO_06395 [Tritrichomonas foetus]|uniref:Uncharacterized protein n=1 Tax=Tritrichomonas foetus TaxID=1144522 RepID=A0A1J4K3P4_9EUKA|nr:hypothetical protein TRFO_06395 [Tritrichomonas foetus]|eukprot:OHT04101.1 hypothetical protein TRFO_06395 [Tritrichomonas foetus]